MNLPAAPLIRPGTSASSARNPSLYSIVPTSGCRVVNGYGAISGWALLIAARSDDFPAFGNPTRPISATISYNENLIFYMSCDSDNHGQ